MVATMRVMFECPPTHVKTHLEYIPIELLLFVGALLAAGKVFWILRLDIELSCTRQRRLKSTVIILQNHVKLGLTGCLNISQ